MIYKSLQTGITMTFSKLLNKPVQKQQFAALLRPFGKPDEQETIVEKEEEKPQSTYCALLGGGKG